MTLTAPDTNRPRTDAVPDKPYQQICATCGESFRVLPCDVRKALLRGNSAPRFCSMKCRNSSYRGAGNPKWRGGIMRMPSGYLYQYAPEHPHATQHGYVMQHRLVMEKAIGRLLSPTEEVHHRNHVRDDNRLENLELMADTSEHRAHHAYYQQSTCGQCGAELTRSVAHRRRWTRAFCSRRCAAHAASAANSAAAKTRRTS